MLGVWYSLIEGSKQFRVVGTEMWQSGSLVNNIGVILSPSRFFA
jgi:hypothetical protein